MAFVAVFSPALSQDVTVECEFIMTRYDEYFCHLTDIEVLDRSANVIFEGQHVADHDNDRVEFVLIRDSRTPFIIPQLFTTFPNLVDLEIDNSGVESIELPDNTNLISLLMNDNNITRIENGTFANNPQLLFMFLINNTIREVEANAFIGLEDMLSLELNENRISALPTTLFAPLVHARHLDVEGNLLTRIEEGTFSENRALVSLFLESNQIHAIAPTFLDNLRETLIIVSLGANECVDSFFVTNTDAQWTAMQNGLATCYRNFNEGTSPRRRIILEFTGSLVITDIDGNHILTVNE